MTEAKLNVTTLTEKAMLVNLSISYWTGKAGDERMADDIMAKRKTERDAIEAKKILVKPEALNAVKAVRSRARAFHFEKTLPWIDGGTRILPSSFYMEYTEKMRDFHKEYEQAIASFLAAFPKLKGEARKRLGDLYKDEDYPTPEMLKTRFGWRQIVSPIPTKEDWRVDIGTKASNEVRKQIDEMLAEAVKVATSDIYRRVYEEVAKLAEKTRDADSKFRDSIVGNIRAILSIVPQMNIGNDRVLAGFCERIEKELAGLDADVLRDDPKERKKAADAADKILAAMKGYI
jgi:hypothetical protein